LLGKATAMGSDFRLLSDCRHQPKLLYFLKNKDDCSSKSLLYSHLIYKCQAKSELKTSVFSSNSAPDPATRKKVESLVCKTSTSC